MTIAESAPATKTSDGPGEDRRHHHDHRRREITWTQVSSHLKAENIIVAEDAASNAGESVDGPLTAWAQADIIQKHALESTFGKTYAELDREDPLRQAAMTASFLRASLFTAMVSFGVAAMAMGRVVNVLLGWALTRLANR